MIDLSDVARSLVASGKGLLAADESDPTADKRLALYGVKGSPETRRQYRELFLEAPGIEQYLSGVILYTETMDQKDDEDNLYFPESLKKHGVIPGIKVDEGTEPFPGSPDELITKGLVGLEKRVLDFKTMHHPSFTKWRAVVKIKGDQLPTAQALVENAKRLAIYASEVQKAGMVPIVEPEVLLEGNHSRIRARDVIKKTMTALMNALEDQAVDLSAVIIKTAMALSGSDSGRTDTPEEVAEDTLQALMDTVPIAIPGIVFLSGGQTPDQATDNLRAIAKRAKELQDTPWPLTFSYARALQDEALEIWKGDANNVPAAREAFMARLKKVSEAAQGH